MLGLVQVLVLAVYSPEKDIVFCADKWALIFLYQASGRKFGTSGRNDSMTSDSTTRDSPRPSVDAQSDDRQEPQYGKALYDFTAGGDEEV